MQAPVTVEPVSAVILELTSLFMESFVSVMTKIALTMKLTRFVEAMERVTVVTATACRVGMAINANMSVTSAHGRARGDARHQVTRRAAAEGTVSVVNVCATT